jgi:hypothetical protein
VRIELSDKSIIYAAPQHITRIVPVGGLGNAKCKVYFSDGGVEDSREDPAELDTRRSSAVRNIYSMARSE